MDHLADRLDRAADMLAAVDRGLSALTVPATALGAEETGLPGRLGRELHAHWAAVVEARAHEASTATSRLVHMADAVRATAEHYTQTDDTARRRLLREI